MTVKAGMNFAQFSGAGIPGFNHFGAAGGVMVNYRFAEKFSFDPEVIYTMKGTRKNPDPENDVYSSYSIDLDYIEVPALFRWHFHRRDRFSLEFGPTFGFLVRTDAYENGSHLSTTPRFNVFELGLAVGINLHLPKGWGLNARFSNSIIPIQPTGGPIPPIGPNIINFGQVNSVLNFSLWYSFGFEKQEKKSADPAPKKEKVKKPKKQRGDIIDED